MQPHSGSTANQAVYFASLQPGDRVLAMNLAHGGHLTHGLSVNFSGRGYQFFHYGVSHETGLIDFDEVRAKALECRPKMIVVGASAYPRMLDFAAFREIADEVGAELMADMAHIAGLVAGGAHPSPVPHCDWVTTTTHKTLTGPRGGTVFCRAENAARLDKAVFPGLQGGPLEHVIAGKAVCFLLASTEEFKQKQHLTVENARTLAATLMQGGLELVSGGTDNHLMLVDFSGTEMTGKQAQETAQAGGHHRQQERRAQRPAASDGHLGPAAGHAGHDDAGLRSRADARGRQHHRRGPHRPADRRRSCPAAAAQPRAHRAFPPVPLAWEPDEA